MIDAPRASVTAQGAVIATRPAKEAFNVIETSGLPFLIHVKIIVVTAATAGAIVVVTNTDARPPTPFSCVHAAPLNPYHPNQRMNVPRAPKVNEWPGIAFTLTTFPFLS